MASMMKSSALRSSARPAATRRSAVKVSAAKKLWFPEAISPSYLDDTLPGDYGWDPLGLGANPDALKWYRQGELQNGRWAMLGAAGVLVQEIVKPDVYFYEAALPQNLPEPFKAYFGTNYGGLLAWEFILMHWVEVLRWQDIQNRGSVNEDPIHKGNKLTNPEPGYPGFDPMGFSKSANFKEWQVKEVKNGRLAMLGFMGFVFAAQTTGKGPLGALGVHLSNPFGSNIVTNIGTCTVPSSVDVQGLTIPLSCLWPGHP